MGRIHLGERQISDSGKDLSLEVLKLVLAGDAGLASDCGYILLDIAPQEQEKGIFLT